MPEPPGGLILAASADRITGTYRSDNPMYIKKTISVLLIAGLLSGTVLPCVPAAAGYTVSNPASDTARYNRSSEPAGSHGDRALNVDNAAVGQRLRSTGNDDDIIRRAVRLRTEITALNDRFVRAVEQGGTSSPAALQTGLRLREKRKLLDELTARFGTAGEPDQEQHGGEIACYDTSGISDTSVISDAGVIMNIAGTGLLGCALLGCISPVAAVVVGGTLAAAGVYFWKWGNGAPEGAKQISRVGLKNPGRFIRDSLHRLKNKDKVMLSEIGACMSIAGIGLTAAAALGLIGGVPVIALAGVLGVVGTYLWKWGLEPPRFISCLLGKEKNPSGGGENLAGEVGVVLNMAAVGALTLGGLGVIASAPAIIFGTGAAVIGTYLWHWGLNTPSFMER